MELTRTDADTIGKLLTIVGNLQKLKSEDLFSKISLDENGEPLEIGIFSFYNLRKKVEEVLDNPEQEQLTEMENLYVTQVKNLVKSGNYKRLVVLTDFQSTLLYNVIMGKSCYPHASIPEQLLEKLKGDTE